MHTEIGQLQDQWNFGGCRVCVPAIDWRYVWECLRGNSEREGFTALDRGLMELDKGRRLSSTRRSNKPLMEKRRRARINSCLSQLKNLVLQAMKKDSAQYSKLEKADILEMTVRHLKTLQRQQLVVAMAADPYAINKYRVGYSECAGEVARYLGSVRGIDPELRTRILGHLSGCLSPLPIFQQGSATEILQMPPAHFPGMQLVASNRFRVPDHVRGGSNSAYDVTSARLGYSQSRGNGGLTQNDSNSNVTIILPSEQRSDLSSLRLRDLDVPSRKLGSGHFRALSAVKVEKIEVFQGRNPASDSVSAARACRPFEGVGVWRPW